MKLVDTNIPGLKIIKSKIFRDRRGFFKEIYQNKLNKKDFIFDVMSYSKKCFERHAYTDKKTSS